MVPLLVEKDVTQEEINTFELISEFYFLIVGNCVITYTSS